MSAPRRILVIEDDPKIASKLVRGLKDAGFAVELHADGEQGMQAGLQSDFDLAVLDLMLPGLHGLEVLEAWQSRSSTPVIVLTAKDTLEARMGSFSRGAVDWMAKPFWMDELLARIRVRLQLREEAPRQVLRFGALELDLDARAVSLGGEPVTLTPSEFNILAFLAERPNRAVSRRQLAEAALSTDKEVSDRTVDSYVTRLRKKLGQESARIKTVWSVGYQLRSDP
ncbi:MAG: response regulator transcription factor [Alphaproteobacteria bacterium]|nr:response regulator transcription factor [Alphaproteobacteria bacterium]